MSIGILNNSELSQPALLDAIRFAETGHLNKAGARTALSPAGAMGPYQFLTRNIHDMGYGMPKNLTVADIQDPNRSRQLAGQYVTGFSDYHNFQTPLEKLVAYNWGPDNAARWKQSGGKFEDLPAETQQYVTRAAQYLDTQSNTGTPDMANTNTMVSDAEALRIAQLLQNPVEPPAPVLATPTTQTASVDPGILQRMANAINPISTAQAADDVSNATMTQPTTQPPASTSAGLPILTNYTPSVTNNRRDQSAMTLPPSKIDNNELLIRMGSAGIRGAASGGLESLAAIGDAYAGAQDLNRTNALAAYNRAMTQRAAQQKQTQEAMGEINKFDATLDNFEKAAGFIGEGGLTGLFQGTVGKFLDRTGLTGDDGAANKRLLLERLRVDDLLVRVAETKGAISNKEMEIFARPAPSMTDDESVWEDWINERIEAIRSVRNKLAAQNGLAQRRAYSPQTNNAGISNTPPDIQEIMDRNS